MNKENIQRVLECIKNEENHFNMLNVFAPFDIKPEPEKHCLTPSCIAGWAIHVKHGGKVTMRHYLENYGSLIEEAGEFLNLSLRERRKLFFAGNSSKYLEEITRKETIACLENFLNTGEINWGL